MVCIIVDVAILGKLLAVIAGKLALGEGGLCIRRRGVAVADKGRIRPADEPSLGIHHDAALVLLDLKVEVLVFEVIVVDNVALLIKLESVRSNKFSLLPADFVVIIAYLFNSRESEPRTPGEVVPLEVDQLFDFVPAPWVLDRDLTDGVEFLIGRLGR